MERTIVAGRLAFDQVDFFESGHRKTGVVWSDLRMQAFLNGTVLSWGLVDGTFTPDSGIGAGSVFFNEIVGVSGYYLVRFFPDRPGFWRIVLANPTLGVEVVCEYDAFPAVPSASGLQASFEPDFCSDPHGHHHCP